MVVAGRGFGSVYAGTHTQVQVLNADGGTIFHQLLSQRPSLHVLHQQVQAPLIIPDAVHSDEVLAVVYQPHFALHNQLAYSVLIDFALLQTVDGVSCTVKAHIGACGRVLC